MNAIKTFFHFLGLSHQELYASFSDYRLSVLGLFFVNLTPLIPWDNDQLIVYNYLENPLSFVVVLINMYLIVNVLMIEKSKFLKQKKDQAFYSYPSFVIYTLYSGLVIIVIPLLIIGLDRGLGFNTNLSMLLAGVLAFFMSVIVSMVPLASVLIDNDFENYFKVSLKLARKSFGVLVLYTILTLLSEAPELLFTFIDYPGIKFLSGVLHSLWDCYVLILVAKVGAKIFYGIYRKHENISL